MPKMRGFKPELWTDDKFVELTPLARLLFMGMWTYACDNGHLDDKPSQIKMRVLPTDNVNASELIDEMVNLGMVGRDKGLLTVRKLREHQRIDDRYFSWCDRCDPADIPEKSRDKHAVATSGARVDTSGARSAPTLKEGRKEVKEGESEGSAAGKPRKKPAHNLPSSWLPSDDHIARCAGAGIDVTHEADKFRAHADANDRRQVNWNAAFTQWLLNARPTQRANVHPMRRQGEGPDDWMRRRL